MTKFLNLFSKPSKPSSPKKKSPASPVKPSKKVVRKVIVKKAVRKNSK